MLVVAWLVFRLRRLGGATDRVPRLTVGAGDRRARRFHGLRRRQVPAARAGLVIEGPVRALVAAWRLVDRAPQVAGPAGRRLLPRLLRVVPGPGQVAVEQRRDELLGEYRRRRRPADPVLL